MLKYIGKGWLPNVPARDLSEDEVKQYGGEAFLLKSGCYERLEEERFHRNTEIHVKVEKGK
jgi:hypothetical protein